MLLGDCITTPEQFHKWVSSSLKMLTDTQIAAIQDVTMRSLLQDLYDFFYRAGSD